MRPFAKTGRPLLPAKRHLTEMCESVIDLI